jgi:hypothetical protein
MEKKLLLQALKLLKLELTFLKCLNTSTMHSGIDDACSVTADSMTDQHQRRYAHEHNVHTHIHAAFCAMRLQLHNEC